MLCFLGKKTKSDQKTSENNHIRQFFLSDLPVLRFWVTTKCIANQTQIGRFKREFDASKIANRGSKAIRANRADAMKIGVFMRINSSESPRFTFRIAGPSTLPCHLSSTVSSPSQKKGEVQRKQRIRTRKGKIAYASATAIMNPAT